MLKRRLSFLVATFSAVIFLTSYAGGPTISQQSFSLKTDCVECIPAFNTLDIEGPVKVVFTGGLTRHCPYATVRSYPGQEVRIWLHGCVLHIKVTSLCSGLPDPVITLNGLALKQILTRGEANVQARNVGRHPLDIEALGSGNVNVNGYVNLARVQQFGTGTVNVLWVNSSVLTVNSNNTGSVKLAGVAQRVYARIRAQSALDAEYLRVKDLWIQTSDASSAKVCAINYLRAFANQSSNIYFYKFPKAAIGQTTESGNSLQMGWHN